MAKINWPLIEKEYVTGVYTDGGKTKKVSTKVLAKKFGVGEDTVRRKCAQEGWVAKREKYLQEIGDLIYERKKEQIVEQAIEFDRSMFQAAKLVMVNVTNRLVVKNKEGSLVPNKKLTSVELQRLSGCLMTVQQVRDKAVGDVGGNEENSLNDLNNILKDMQIEPDQEVEEDDIKDKLDAVGVEF